MRINSRFGYGGMLILVAGCVIGTAVEGQGRSAGPKGNPAEFFGPDAYPVEALRASEQGRAVVKLYIDSGVKVVSCNVQSSSGSASLDRTTCQIALEKVIFEPATDRRGRPTASIYILPVRWVLPTGPVEVGTEPLEATVEVTVSFSAEGEIIACNFQTDASQARAQINFCGEFVVGKKVGWEFARSGRSVGGTFVRTIKQRFILNP